jgi:hemerythrin-like domain-containing protein
MSNENQPNIGEDFIRFHRIVTRSLEVAIQNVNEFLERGALEKSKREGFLNFVQSLSTFVEAHHLVENEKVFPYFKDKLPDVPYKRLMSEHQEIETALKEINSGLTNLRSEGDESNSLGLLKSGLSNINLIWHPHIQIEESQLYERVGSLKINLEEMNRIRTEFSQFFQEHIGPAYLMMPFILYNLSPEDRAVLVQGLPEAVTKQLIPIDWKDKWASMQPFLLK